MRKSAFILALTVSLLAAPPVLAVSPPAQQAESGPALAIIRFNQRTVYFEKALYNAVSRAVEVKPDVVFTLVLKPGARGDGDAAVSRVAQAMQDMGVPKERIHTREGRAAGRYNEVHIYVE